MCVLATAFHHDDMVTEVGLDEGRHDWLVHRRRFQRKCCILEWALCMPSTWRKRRTCCQDIHTTIEPRVIQPRLPPAIERDRSTSVSISTAYDTFSNHADPLLCPRSILARPCRTAGPPSTRKAESVARLQLVPAS